MTYTVSSGALNSTPTPTLASLKSRLVLPFWYRLTWVVADKGPLYGCKGLENVMIYGQLTVHEVPCQNVFSFLALTLSCFQTLKNVFNLQKVAFPIVLNIAKWSVNLSTYRENGARGNCLGSDVTLCQYVMWIVITGISIIAYYWHCLHNMRSRVYETVQCLSVCLSQQGPTAANLPRVGSGAL